MSGAVRRGAGGAARFWRAPRRQRSAGPGPPSRGSGAVPALPGGAVRARSPGGGPCLPGPVRGGRSSDGAAAIPSRRPAPGPGGSPAALPLRPGAGPCGPGRPPAGRGEGGGGGCPWGAAPRALLGGCLDPAPRGGGGGGWPDALPAGAPSRPVPSRPRGPAHPAPASPSIRPGFLFSSARRERPPAWQLLQERVPGLPGGMLLLLGGRQPTGSPGGREPAARAAGSHCRLRRTEAPGLQLGPGLRSPLLPVWDEGRGGSRGAPRPCCLLRACYRGDPSLAPFADISLSGVPLA